MVDPDFHQHMVERHYLDPEGYNTEEERIEAHHFAHQTVIDHAENEYPTGWAFEQ